MPSTDQQREPRYQMGQTLKKKGKGIQYFGMRFLHYSFQSFEKGKKTE